jgi:hypothetical protein
MTLCSIAEGLKEALALNRKEGTRVPTPAYPIHFITALLDNWFIPEILV